MAVKNYTSSVPVINSIGKIEFKLARAGASNITKIYNGKSDGIPQGMAFQINGLLYQMPTRADKVERYLLMDRRRPATQSQKEAIHQQAMRTSWKNLSDYVDLIVSFIELDQIELAEAFFPYLYSEKHNKTLFEVAKEVGMNKLLEARK